jgi:FMN phosphatase YigB (HAD superfamily)
MIDSLSELIKRHKSWIFDLDNTLFNEDIYLNQAYYQISEFIETHYGINNQKFFNELLVNRERYGRNKLFDRVLKINGLSNSLKDGFLEILRLLEPNPNLKLFNYVHGLFYKLLNKNCNIFIVTNGNVIQQKNKIHHLNIEKSYPKIKILYANEFVPKPSPSSFIYLQDTYKIKCRTTIMVGDSENDEFYARNCNIEFLSVNYFTISK